MDYNVLNMAERVARNITSDYLTCIICWNTYNDPKMLQCGHSFCASCLEDYIRTIQQSKDIYECPICRTEYSISAGTEPSEVIRNLHSDQLSLSILKAIERQSSNSDNGIRDSSVEVLKGDVKAETTGSANSTKSYCPCSRHQDKKLEVYCYFHDTVICSECAWRDHRHERCECVSAQEIIQKRFIALKSLVVQQAEDANDLLDEGKSEKTVHTVKQEFHKSISEIEESFNEVCKEFRQKVTFIRNKAEEALEKDLTITTISQLREELFSKIKSLETRLNTGDPNESIKILADLCISSSLLQNNIQELTDKVNTGSLMKYAEGDLETLDAFVSGSKTTLPKEFLSYDDLYRYDPNEKDFVLITQSGRFPDLPETVREPVDKCSQFVFSAQRPSEGKCMLSGIALIGTTAVVVVDQGNKNIKKFKIPEGKFLHELTLAPYEPHQIATMKESSNVVVTFWDQSCIFLVATDPILSPLMTIQTDVEYIGVTFLTSHTFAVSSIQAKRVDVFAVDSTLTSMRRLETIYRSCRRRSFPDRLTTTPHGHAVVRKRCKNEIVCLDRNSVIIWSRRLKSKVADVTCFHGYVFATLPEQNEIVYFQDDGQGELGKLPVKGQLTKPWSIASFKDCLVVTQDCPSDLVNVFAFW